MKTEGSLREALGIQEGFEAPLAQDINCLPEGSQVLTRDGYRINIEKLPEIAPELKIFNTKEGHNDSSEILFVSKRKTRKGERIIKIETEDGYIIEASEDHPVLTIEGWKKAGELKEGEYIIVYPFEGVNYESSEEFKILDEEDFKEFDKQILKKLRNLIPLTTKSKEIGKIARIFGYILGDGSIGVIKTKDRGKERERIITWVYGDEKYIKEIKKDIESLGFEVGGPYKRIRKSKINGKEFVGKEVSIKVNSKAFGILLNKLGIPIGNKTEKEFFVPEWVKKSPLWVKRNFLAGLFGSDGSLPEILKNGFTVSNINIGFSKKKELEDNLKEFLSGIANLLEEFGIESNIYKVYEKDEKVYYRLYIEGEENIYKFLNNIGYEYSIKKEKALYILAYLRKKRRYKEKMKKERVWEGKFERFEEFLRKYVFGGGFVRNRIVNISESIGKDLTVYDIGVEHPEHNFIANNVVVHNCGVRVIRTNFTVDEIRPKLKELVDTIFRNVPSGVGRSGKLRLSFRELDEVLERGVEWAVEHGFGWPEDLDHIEENGRLKDADASKVSQRAKQRGAPQLGTLGAGNHFLEIQRVDKIYDERIAKKMGLFENQVVVMIHTGSRGLGHQVASDYLYILRKRFKDLLKKIPDEELVFAPSGTKEFEDYWKAMCAAANYAWTNRQIIMHWTRESFRQVFKMDPEDMGMRLIYDVAHNIGKIEFHKIDGKKRKVIVHRKGATRAFPPGHPEIPKDYQEIGQPVLIPGSMGTASYILVGTEKAMEMSFGSTTHGSGRLMSRHKAIKTWRGEQIRNELLKRGIYIRAASLRVVAEEAPGAYKDVDEVVKTVDAVGISKKVARMVPLGVVKG